MARKKKPFDEKMEDLNLVPIMNLVVCLIPMVLLGMSLVKVGVVNVNAPKFGMGQSAPADDDKKPLNLTVGVEEAGFRLKAGGADLNLLLGIEAEVPSDPSQPVAGGIFIPKIKDVDNADGRSYNYVDLYGKMVKIKDQFPDESVVNLTADSKMPFKHIIATMDTMRIRLEADAYDEWETFANAKYKFDGDKMQLLWPDVIFAVAQ